MKIYYDKNSTAVVMDSLHFSGGSLISENIDDKIFIKYKALNIYENVLKFDEVQKEDGSQAGLNNQEVIDYLNSEFNKGGSSGQGEFSGNSLMVTIVDNLIFENDIIIVQPFGNSVNDLIFVSNVFNGGFTVTRTVINSLIGLTNDLKFNWLKL